MSQPVISAVVITRNEGENLRHTVQQLQATLPQDCEVIVVDDGSTDGSTEFLAAPGAPARLLRGNAWGVARARNQGARAARGDILVFSDAHLQVPPGWWIPMVELLANPAVGAVAPAVSDVEEPYCKGFGLRLKAPEITVEWLEQQGEAPYPVPLLPGCFWGMRREVFEAVGGFDEGMICWATEDTELSLRLWLLGYELWLVPAVEVVHLFRVERPFTVEWSWVLHNRLRLADVHFSDPRRALVREALQTLEGFPEALSLLAQSDAEARRRELAARRRRDDEWFFRTFGPDW
jgi:GT2 family glycosyltransferase